MIRLANVLIVHDDANVTEAVTARLSHNGYHAICVTSLDQALAHVHAGHLDLIIVGNSPMSQIDFGSALRADRDGADIPVVIGVSQISARMMEDALSAGLDDVISWDCEDTELIARLRPLVRLATMHSELDQRVAIGASLGQISRPQQLNASASCLPAILVIGQDHDGIAPLFLGMANITTSLNLYDAESLLERQNFDAAILCAEGESEPYLAFSSQIRNNPRLFNLPLVMVLDGMDTAAEAYRHGASRVMIRPVPIDIFRPSVMMLVRRQQLRWAIRSALAECLEGPSRDMRTGAYSRAFLDQYLETRLSIAKTHQRHLAVVFFSIPNVEGVRSHFGDDAADHLIQQLGQWIGGLLRAEDLTAIYGKHEFCVVLPDTPMVEAEVVMHRIAGVLAYTDFAVREVYQPIKVWVQVGCTNVKPNDTLDTLVTRARSKLD